MPLSNLVKVVLIDWKWKELGGVRIYMEEVRWPSPEILGCYLKNIFPNILSNTFLDFISDVGVTDHKEYDW